MQNVQLPVTCPPFKSNPALGAIKKSVSTWHQNLGGHQRKGETNLLCQSCCEITICQKPPLAIWKKVLLDTRRWNQDVNRVRQTSIWSPTNSIARASAVTDAPNNCPQISSEELTCKIT